MEHENNRAITMYYSIGVGKWQEKAESVSAGTIGKLVNSLTIRVTV